MNISTRTLGVLGGIVVIAIFFLDYLHTRPTVIEIEDVTKETTMVLEETSGINLSGIISTIRIRVHGEIDGTAEISVYPYDPETISGTVDWEFGQDWFQETCKLKYAPQDVKSGKLKVEYVIH